MLLVVEGGFVRWYESDAGHSSGTGREGVVALVSRRGHFEVELEK